jgi:hypothetical protein
MAKLRNNRVRLHTLLEGEKLTSVPSYGFVDDDRLLLSDSFGRLHLLSLARRGPTPFTYALSVALLGEVSSPFLEVLYLA